jgi:histidine triad (HIT) family protein
MAGELAAGPAAGDCIFCLVLAGAETAYIVAADQHCVAFLDARPAAAGHTLVVPRRHVETLWDADDTLVAALMLTTRQVAALLRDRLRPDGLTVRQNNGRASGQRVPHLHMHLVPRWEGDGTIGWPLPPREPVDHESVLQQLLADPAQPGGQPRTGHR